MLSRRRSLIGCALAATALAAVAGPASAVTTADKTAKVTVADDYFAAARTDRREDLEEREGQVGLGERQHRHPQRQAHRDSPEGRQAEGLQLLLGRGRAVFKRKFKVPGKYGFICTYHSSEMKRRDGQEVGRSWDLEPFGRRELFAGTGGAVPMHARRPEDLRRASKADVEQLASEVPVPPKVRRPPSVPTARRLPRRSSPGPTGARREYWIQAEQVKWNIVPSGRDAMMDKKVKGQTKFSAYAYRPYSAGLRRADRAGDDPGADDRGRDRRRDRGQLPQQGRFAGDDPPARVFYAQEMDGAYKGRHTDPGGFVQKKQTFQYVWEARAGHRGRRGSTTTTGRWSRCPSTRACSGR